MLASHLVPICGHIKNNTRQASHGSRPPAGSCQRRAPDACQAHNLEEVGSIPTSATITTPAHSMAGREALEKGAFFVFKLYLPGIRHSCGSRRPASPAVEHHAGVFRRAAMTVFAFSVQVTVFGNTFHLGSGWSKEHEHG